VKRVVLGLVVLALVATGFWLYRDRRRSEMRVRLSDARLVEFDDREVTGLEIRTPRATWSVERAGEGWAIGAPVRDVADATTVSSLMSSLRLSPVMRTIEEPEALASYGLEPATAEIVLRGVQVPRVWLGTLIPTMDGVFARVEGRAGVLVLNMSPDGYLAATNPIVLRQQALVDLVGTSLRRVELRSRGGTLRLVREADGWWTAEPGRLPASDATVTALIDSLVGTQVAGFLDDADPVDPALGLGPEGLEVVLASPTVSRTLRIGGTVGQYDRAVKRSDREPVLLVAAADLESLPLDLDAYRGVRLTRVNRYKVVSFRYVADGETLEARRQGEDGPWLSGGVELPEEQVYLLLSRLLEMRGSWLPADSGSGGRPPAAVLEFETEDGLPERIEYGADGTATIRSVPEGRFKGSSPPPPPVLG
jgi:hypothetical protein